MEVYVTEEQQVEAIKKWFDKYGGMISWTVIILCSILLAVMYWRHHQEVVREQASEAYIAMLESVDHDSKTLAANADILMKDYPNSPYAALASLVLAQESVKAKDLAKAQQQLEWAVTHAKFTDIQALAQFRLMRLLFDQDKLDEALQAFNQQQQHADGYLTLMAELKGDILLKQNKLAEAKEAYLLAYKSAPQDGMHGFLLKMKMQALGIDIPTKEANQT